MGTDLTGATQCISHLKRSGSVYAVTRIVLLTFANPGISQALVNRDYAPVVLIDRTFSRSVSGEQSLRHSASRPFVSTESHCMVVAL